MHLKCNLISFNIILLYAYRFIIILHTSMLYSTDYPSLLMIIVIGLYIMQDMC